MKDAVATMGTVLTGLDVPERDAVHVAVIAVEAGEMLWPGHDVYHEEGRIFFYSDGPQTAVGIVDPFLKGRVKKGEKVWLYLYPRTITGLNHVWTHPAFPDKASPAPVNDIYAPPASKLDSVAWIQKFADEADCPGYYAVMEKLEALADGRNLGGWGDDEYMHFNDMDAHGEIPDELYDHAEKVLGKKIKIRPKYFSCSC